MIHITSPQRRLDRVNKHLASVARPEVTRCPGIRDDKNDTQTW